LKDYSRVIADYDKAIALNSLRWKSGEVATDGSKIKASASKHKGIGFARMCRTIEKYENEIPELKAPMEMANSGSKPMLPKQLEELNQDFMIRENRLSLIKSRFFDGFLEPYYCQDFC
jgi:hypothetical protein